ncbi:MAG: right-handed parallel beta-helix repeat-containing protein [Alphaproteobacteria bacterium]
MNLVGATLVVAGLTLLSQTLGADAPAGIVTAVSGSAQDIQAAVDRAQPGNTVVIPAGTFDFNGQVFMPDGIHLRGMGRDRTILVKRDDLTEWNAMITVDCATGSPFTFSGITLQGRGRFIQGDSKKGGPVRDQGLYLRGQCQDFQIYDSRFTKFSRAGIQLHGDAGSVRGSARGVIYENEFIDNWYPNLGYGVEVVGNQNAWEEPLDLGSVNAVVIEDNVFEKNRHTVAANNGARYVFRHNTIIDNYANAAAIDAHGLASWPRGSRSYEIYENTVRNSVTRWAGVGVRGGDGVIFNNRFEGVNKGILLMVERYKDSMTYPVQDQIRDLWIWNNMANGKPIRRPDFWRRQSNVSALIAEGRDYHMAVKPDYVPLAYPHPLRTATMTQ